MAIQELAARPLPVEPAGLPSSEQVRGMIASALHTADGKVWRVVQKVIDRREAWPRLARENANMPLGLIIWLAVPFERGFWPLQGP